jgi:hypothetical protein
MVHLLLSEQRLTQTSAPERMLQILQIVQSDHVHSTSISIVPEFMLPDVGTTYTYLGFSKKAATKTTDATVFTRNSPIKISKFTNQIMWGRYGTHLTMCNEVPEGMESLLQMQCRLVSQLLLRPMSADQAIGIKYRMTDPRTLSITYDVVLSSFHQSR